MQADPITNIATWTIGGGLLFLTVVYALSIRAYIRPTTFSLASQISIMTAYIISLVVYIIVTQITANPVIVATAGFSGLLLGYLLCGTRKIFIYKGNIEIKRSIISGVIAMVAYISSAFFNIFGGANLMSLGIVMVILATGVAVGSVVADSINGIKMESKIGQADRVDTRTEQIEQPAQPKTQTRLPI
jgi:hypothetical protein